jgi:hypothetical protein
MQKGEKSYLTLFDYLDKQTAYNDEVSESLGKMFRGNLIEDKRADESGGLPSLCHPVSGKKAKKRTEIIWRRAAHYGLAKKIHYAEADKGLRTTYTGARRESL